jgi:hypothetical protein
MALRKKATKKKAGKTRAKRKTPREAFDANLKSLEKQLPPRLAKGVRELRKNMKDLERQIDKARADRQARWHDLETQIRKDAAKALRRLEQAIEPKRKKAAARKKAAGK